MPQSTQVPPAKAPRSTSPKRRSSAKSKSPAKTEVPPSEQNPPAPTHDQIAQRAYEIWISKGRPYGQDEQNWIEAEAQLTLGLKGEGKPEDEKEGSGI